MARKPNRPKKLPPPKIKFAIEDNAEQLLQQAIEKMPASIDKSDGSCVSRPKPATDKKSATDKRIELDLHGHTFAESQQRIDQLFRRIINNNSVQVRIITGKGRHSRNKNNNLLARDVHAYVLRKYQSYIIAIDQSPHRVKIGSLPIRGHFDVTLRRK